MQWQGDQPQLAGSANLTQEPSAPIFPASSNLDPIAVLQSSISATIVGEKSKSLAKVSSSLVWHHIQVMFMYRYKSCPKLGSKHDSMEAIFSYLCFFSTVA